jgi:hypothetical protein
MFIDLRQSAIGYNLRGSRLLRIALVLVNDIFPHQGAVFGGQFFIALRILPKVFCNGAQTGDVLRHR